MARTHHFHADTEADVSHDMSVIFEWAKSDAHPKKQPANFFKELRPLLEAFSGDKAGDIDDARAEAYIRQSIAAGYRDASARGHLHRLKMILTAYGTAHVTDIPILFDPGRADVNKVIYILKRDQVIQMINATSNLMKIWGVTLSRSEIQRGGGRRQKNYAHLARYVLLALLTGCTEKCARHLRWQPSADGRASYVDLDAGLLHRLGDDASDFKKFADAPVRIPPALRRLMRQWRRSDARRGFDLVIHAPHGQPIKSTLGQALTNLVAPLGLSTVTPQTLIDTCAATALQRGAPLYGVAIMLGINPVVALRRYDHFRHDYQDRPIAAFDRLLTSNAETAKPKRTSSSNEHSSDRA